ncbi:hypothetical protein [Candidatus Electronema sp. JC]|uniref:hypothetical protein n=1 Tax=Candidatus Electronema sp. JC TaxID=3401570 RepID=UPI003B438473
MKKKIICAALACLAGAAQPPAAALAADVCGEGVGIPPFLSSGAKPNLLMVLDNSGSMLDAAYSQEGELLDANGQPVEISSGLNALYQRCVDGDYEMIKSNDDTIEVTGYDSTATYAGYFKNDAWYKWSPGEYLEWTNGANYTEGTRVYAGGNIYEAATDGVADGSSIDKDTGVQWRHLTVKNILPSLQYWINNRAYPANSFTWSGPQLYYTAAGGTSSDSNTANGLSLLEDTGITWVAVEHTWRDDLTYAVDDIVSYKGIYYQALTAGTGKIPDATKGVNWKSLRQGEFQEITASAAASHCSGATGTKYTRADNLCITVDNTTTPKKVNAFAARGNLLNWAMASKFDVQKKILTGGKHSYHEGVLIAEHRGCSGSRLIKQVKLDGAAGYLVLGVRGSKSEFDDQFIRDKVDTSDDTSRLEVLAVNATGYQSSAECQEMMDTMMTKDPKGANWSQAITACLETFPENDAAITHQRPMLNHSLQFCSKFWNGDQRNINTVQKECGDLYTGTSSQPTAYHPSTLEPAYGAYICYGIYDSNLPHGDRAGYIGRCWKSPEGAWKTCVPKPAVPNPDGCNITGKSTFCYYGSSGNWFKNEIVNGAEYNYSCNVVAEQATSCTTNDWKPVYEWSDGSGGCAAGTPPQMGGGSSSAGEWEEDPSTPQDRDYTKKCIIEASEDYCRDTAVPEVIDPSDQAGDTTKVWNIPGVVADSHIIAMMGGTQPLATMKGYIQRGARPEGVVHRVASDLRLGVMALRYVGAATECQASYLTDGIQRFCPQNNRDGGELLVEMEVGDTVKADDGDYPGGKRRHMHDLADAINSVRGTSWTPLAETLYNALGYFTQNDSFCFNFDENGKCADFPICESYNSSNRCTDAERKDPVQYWCQDNHILLITEGESTADVQADVVGFASNPSAEDKTKRFPSALEGDDLDGDGTAEPDFTPGTSTPCGDKLFRSTYLDDMTWWGQNAGPLYQKRHLLDSDGRSMPKQNIYTHVVTTGTLTNSGTGECNPVTLMTQAAASGGTTDYYPGENPQQLEDNLYAVLDDILSRSSAGSAASVISSSRSGSGAVYQAVFWPKHEDDATPKNKVTWIGDVHSLFVSSEGKMYEDSNGNGRIDLDGGDTADKRVIFYFSNKANRTRGCYADLNSAGQCPDEPEPAEGNLDPKCAPENTTLTPQHSCVEITDIKYLWSANKRLAAADVMNERKIYTWNDVNNNGIVDSGEFFTLTDLRDQLDALNSKTNDADLPRGSVGKDFITPEDWETFAGYTPRRSGETEVDYKKRREQEALDALVQWLQGLDSLNDETTDETADGKGNGNGRLDTSLRSRQFTFKDVSGSTVVKEWRLGDIIHSTPIVVAKPAEYYHYIYRDPTYKDFVEKWSGRRNMVYFGGNDGMLHAVNGGFHFENNGSQFCCTEDINTDGSCKVPPVNGECSSGPDLGAEKWAYIPYNLQPHLKCLADKYYAHKYYVDQKPRIFDVQIFKADEDHPGGWGTILVGALRFGGAPIKASELNGDPDDKRVFTSSFFILDITNPEKEPVLLGEMTQLLDENGKTVYADMGYTTSSPAMVVMRDGYPNSKDADNIKTDWYLVLGSGPTDMSKLDGVNIAATPGKLAVLPLGWLPGPATNWNAGAISAVGSQVAFRIPKEAPGSNGNGEGGIFTLPGTVSSFISDIISVDYNVNLTAPGKLGARYRADAVYFGTVDGADFTQYPSGYQDGLEEQFYWDKGGRIFRLVTKMLGGTEDANGNGRLDIGEDENNNGKLDVGNVEQASKPSGWPGMWTDGNPIRLLADVKMPVVGAPSIGYDGSNYWIYAGTGRFYGDRDKTDDGWCLPGSSTDCDSDGDRSKIGYFGLKEPLKDANTLSFNGWSTPLALPETYAYHNDPIMTWAAIEWDINTQDNGDLPADPAAAIAPGKRGLMQTDKIIVSDINKSPYVDESGARVAPLKCYDCKTNVLDRSKYSCSEVASSDADYCFPSNIWDKVAKEIIDTRDDSSSVKPTFDLLVKYIAGEEANKGFMTKDGKEYSTGLDGWYRDFHDLRERNLGAAALLGGLLTYTTYQPFNDKCKAEGESTLYGVHYQTGTAWTETVFGTFDSDDGAIYQGAEDGEFVMDKLSLGRGLSTSPSMHVGTGDQAAKAFIQTSTGEIIEVEQENLPINTGKSGRINWTDRCGQ